MQKAVIIYGPPGAGKGTQANLLSWTRHFVHFDTGKYLESVVHSPANKRNKTIQRERVLFDTGKLLTPAWVLSIVAKRAKEIGGAGYSVVFSGSPRTMFEAFGDEKTPGLLKTLSGIFGKKNVKIFYLDIRPETSIHRNSNRKICSVCGNPLLYNERTHHHTRCPLCAGKLRRRTLDKPEVIKVRLIEYKNRTWPIVKAARTAGYNVVRIDGEKLPFEVLESIQRQIK